MPRTERMSASLPPVHTPETAREPRRGAPRLSALRLLILGRPRTCEASLLHRFWDDFGTDYLDDRSGCFGLYSARGRPSALEDMRTCCRHFRDYLAQVAALHFWNSLATWE
jgi:hypothetical protein